MENNQVEITFNTICHVTHAEQTDSILDEENIVLKPRQKQWKTYVLEKIRVGYFVWFGPVPENKHDLQKKDTNVVGPPYLSLDNKYKFIDAFADDSRYGNILICVPLQVALDVYAKTRGTETSKVTFHQFNYKAGPAETSNVILVSIEEWEYKKLEDPTKCLVSTLYQFIPNNSDHKYESLELAFFFPKEDLFSLPCNTNSIKLIHHHPRFCVPKTNGIIQNCNKPYPQPDEVFTKILLEKSKLAKEIRKLKQKVDTLETELLAVKIKKNSLEDK